MLILPGSIAVHSAITGDILWKRQAEQVDRNRLTDPRMESPLIPFITKDIAGYIANIHSHHINNEGGSDDYYEYTVLRAYDTESGHLLATMQIPNAENLCYNCNDMVVRGCILCCTSGLVIQVFRVVRNEVRSYELIFPVVHFLMSGQLIEHPGPYRPPFQMIDLLGFLGKTNVLIACLRSNKFTVKNVLFSLDLDAAFAARDEEETRLAFGIITPCCDPSSPWQQKIKPIYRTDRSTGQVEMVGIVHPKYSGVEMDYITLENEFFVTEMDLPSDN